MLTLAHELGHGLHAYLARPQGVFHQGTPLTLAETASVFGETVTFGRLLDETTEPGARLALLAENIEGAIATVFRQTAMNRFEDAAHTARRDEGELSVDRIGELWAQSQEAMLGDAVEVTEGYRTLVELRPALHRHPRLRLRLRLRPAAGPVGVPPVRGAGLGLRAPLPRTCSRPAGRCRPRSSGSIVGCDLADPAFWDGGIAIIEQQLEAAESAAFEAGRLT